MFNIKAQLLALGLMASLGAANTHDLGFGEVDLIFPRNGTFEPMELMPVIFAYQNPRVIDGLYPYLRYGVWPVDLPRGNQSMAAYFDDGELPLNTTDPVWYLKGSIPSTQHPESLNTENEWQFNWGIEYTNCSTSTNGTTSDDKPEFNLSGPSQSQSHSIRFTTKKGAGQPNLTALTADDNCDDISAIVFNVKKTLIAQSGYLEGDKCAVLDTPAPTPSPCKVSIVPSAASSIAAAITSAKCRGIDPVVSCPAKHSGAAITDIASSLKWWTTSVLIVGAFLI
ncbi:hypothetical protein N7455_011111 [Penicillium solitum]|uniref:DUF7136 domain-containing protein n=2 Tax=Penicillium TaxID=5073 RepID=A0A1V6Q1T8_9EURO|nr:uncharacterized protein PENSOL_c155G06360 [Penicillium solitum]KAJ5686462.1 hypothetical protein N7536_009081 [Penicillium majusculum]KAJ5847154.1 hypothetical protein N7455_011111 [Penicillium solitum]OQD83203.1 hypothetical protein PENSOL_c155G06360 [Penicillium solitum]